MIFHRYECKTKSKVIQDVKSNILWLIMKEMIWGQSLEVFVFNTSLVEFTFNFSYAFIIKQYFFKCSDCKSITSGSALVLLVGRPLFQTCICVERYVGVLHPLTFLKFKPMKYRLVIAAIGWILIICSCILTNRGVVYFSDLLMPQYLAFLITEVFSCLMVLKALRCPGPGDDVKKRDGVNRDKVKAFQIIQIVLVSSVLTYSPLFIGLLLYYILDHKMFVVSLSVSFCTGVMLGFVHPLLSKELAKCVFVWAFTSFIEPCVAELKMWDFYNLLLFFRHIKNIYTYIWQNN